MHSEIWIGKCNGKLHVLGITSFALAPDRHVKRMVQGDNWNETYQYTIYLIVGLVYKLWKTGGILNLAFINLIPTVDPDWSGPLGPIIRSNQFYACGAHVGRALLYIDIGHKDCEIMRKLIEFNK